MVARSLVVFYGGEASEEVAKQVCSGAAARCGARARQVAASARDEAVRALTAQPGATVAVVVLETCENDAPAPQAERFVSALLKARTCDYCSAKTSRSKEQCGAGCPYVSELQGLRFAVVAVGDTNLLLDRQTTTAKDCNRVGQQVDGQLAKLGASRMLARCEANEAVGLEEAVEPWLERLWPELKKALD